jgi:AsmA protein
MSFMKRIVPILIAFALVCGIGIAALFFLLSPAYMSQKLADSVRQASGLEVQFTSKPRLELVPEILVRFENVTLSGPDGPVAQIPMIIVRAGPQDLLARRFSPRAIEFVRPDIQLVVSPEGTGNWTPEAGVALNPAGVPAILIREGNLSFLDERSGDRFEATSVDAKLAPGDDGPGVGVEAAFVWNDDRLKLSAFVKDVGSAATEGTPADITVQASRVNFSFSGQARLDQGLALSGQMDVEVPDLFDFAKWNGIDLARASTALRFSASGPFDIRTGRVGFRQADYRFNGMDAKGDVMLFTAGRKPQLVAALNFEKLDLDGLAAKPSADGDWSDARLDLSALSVMDLDLKLAARQLRWRDIAASSARMDVELKQGALTAELREAKLGQGTATASLTLGTADDLAKIGFKLRTAGADATQLGQWLFATDKITGACDMTLDITAQGESMRALVGALAGTGSLSLTGAIADVDLPGLMKAVSQKVITGWAPVDGASTGVERLSASFSISDGIAETKDLVLQGARVKLAAAGRVDFLRGFMELQSTPELMAAETGNSLLPVDLITRGPWAKPKFYPDMPGILENPDQAYAALRALKPTAPGTAP